MRFTTWAELGAEPRARYEAHANATQRFAIAEPHHHLNMIGVRRSHHRLGIAQSLLDAVHALADADPTSAGVSLTTERAENVAFYEYFGYEVRGHARVAHDLETWTMFRPRSPQQTAQGRTAQGPAPLGPA